MKVVLKFGGSSVANGEQISKVLDIVRKCKEEPVVVASAHKGMTDALIKAATTAASGTCDPEPVIEKQKAICRTAGCPDGFLEEFYAEIRDLLRGIHLVREASPRSLDYISSFGERMSVRVIAHVFNERGTAAKAWDAWELGMITDASFGAARPLAGYEERIPVRFAEAVSSGVVPIVTGFIGRASNGDITTLGRNGSDLTATLLAAALGAAEAQIWTDTDGVMTADPSVVPGARSIPSMRFDEAAELAFFGTKVLHPSTLLPAMQHNIPVRVLNTNRPDHPGTVIFDHEDDGTGVPVPGHGHKELSRGGMGQAAGIQAFAAGEGASANGATLLQPPVTSIAYKEGNSVLTISSPKMFGAHGYIGELFGVLGRHQVVVDVVATSEVSISLTSLNRPKLEAAMAELQRLAMGDCRLVHGKTILVVVGKDLKPGLGAAMLRAVADAGATIEMLSYAMGSVTFTMVVDDADIGRAVPVLHRLLFEGGKLPLAIDNVKN